MLKMLLVVAGLGVFLTQNSLIVTAKMQEQMQNRLKAKELTSKVEYIQNKMDIESVLQNKQISNLNEINVNPNIKIIPSSTLSSHDEILFVKLDRAIDEYFETNNPSIEPTCSALDSTGIITESECNEIKAKDINTFSIVDNVITYKVDPEIQRHLNALSALRQRALDSNGSFIDDDTMRYSQSKKLNRWKLAKLKVMKNLFNQYMKKKDYLTASNIAKKVSYTNPSMGIIMSDSITHETSLSSTLSSVEKKDILENVLQSNIVAKSSLKKDELSGIGEVTIDDLDIRSSVKSELLNSMSDSEIQDSINRYINR